VIDRGRYFLNKGIKTPILGKIEFRKVSIVKGDRQIFTDLNFTIPVGSTIGIIGSSGGGKTTFVDSILRFISPNIGQIFIDDKEIREYDVDYLRQNIALVEQEPDLFDDTVNENIALADPTREFDLLDIMAASSAADLTSFMEQRKVTKDTMIDNDKLSGGQKQRIAVARAFYKRAPIVIMDEPTSALDSIAAQKVIHEVVSMGKNRTTIIITHDLDLLKQIPYVFVVGDGAIRSIQEYGGLDTYYASHSNLL
jgi:ABC-type multidrug transport system fused ATPase/permease subunit